MPNNSFKPNPLAGRLNSGVSCQMDEATTLLLKIYAGGYALGLLPFAIYVLIQRRFTMSRTKRASLCALIASITATPVFFVPGWYAVFLPVSLGYWLAPGLLGWTLTQVIPETPWIHALSFFVTATVGFLTGWLVKPRAANHSFKPNPTRGAA